MHFALPHRLAQVAKKDGGGGSMAFVLPRDVTDAPPVPLTAEIALETVPARLVAVKPFPGIVTDAEAPGDPRVRFRKAFRHI